jgi:hypothetical protein
MYNAPAPLKIISPSLLSDVDTLVVGLAACAVLVSGRVALTASSTAGWCSIGLFPSHLLTQHQPRDARQGPKSHLPLPSPTNVSHTPARESA